MKTLIQFALIPALLALSLATTVKAEEAAAASIGASAPSVAEAMKKELQDAGVEQFTSSSYKVGLLKHVVLFRYDEGVSAEQKAEVKKRFLALKDLCRRNGKKYIVSIETGAQNSGEGVDQSLEQGFIVTFKSQGDRNYYVGQPIVSDPAHYEAAHQAFKDFVGPLLHKPVSPSGVLVFDFAVGT